MNFHILDWAAYTPNVSEKETWMSWAKSDEDFEFQDGQPDVKFLPLMLRRRLGRLSKMSIWTLYQLDEALRKDAPLVFASRHGDSSATNEILQIIATKSEISPADFSLSVHNACPGLYSIHTKNQTSYSAISAGDETFSMGLFESVSLSKQLEKPVLFNYVENDLNPKFQCYISQKLPPHAMTFCVLATEQNADYQIDFLDDSHKTEAIPSFHFLKWMLKPKETVINLDRLCISKQT